MRRRDAAFAAVDSLWQRRVRPALQPFLNHIQQRDGQVILSPVLEGEGRTVTVGKQDNTVACGLPATADRAMDAIHCLLHELVGALTTVAVEDNVTPAEKRSGVADKYQSLALVRGGALLAAKLGPDVACVVVQTPDFFGNLHDYTQLGNACRAAGIISPRYRDARSRAVS